MHTKLWIIQYPVFTRQKHGADLCYKLESLTDLPSTRTREDGPQDTFFAFWYTPGDQRSFLAFDLLEKSGWRMLREDQKGKLDERYRYKFEIERAEKKVVLEQCEWLDLSVKGSNWNSLGSSDSNEVLVVQPRKFTQIAHLGEGGQIFVSEMLRQEMLDAGIIGATFLPTVTVKDHNSMIDPSAQRKSWQELNLPMWWWLASDRVLPRPTCKLVDIKGRPFVDGDYSWFCFVSKGIYDINYIRYARSTLDSFKDVDVIVTRERFGLSKELGAPSVIVSQKFRKLSIARKWPFAFSPVIIDEPDGTHTPNIPIETPPELKKYMLAEGEE